MENKLTKRIFFLGRLDNLFPSYFCSLNFFNDGTFLIENKMTTKHNFPSIVIKS